MQITTLIFFEEKKMKTTRNLVTLSILILAIGLPLSADAATVWNPAGNGIIPPATGFWGDGANWAGGAPGISDTAVFNVPGAADCWVTTSQTFNRLTQGDSGPGGLIRVQSGGALTTGDTWSAIGYDDTAHTIVEANGAINFGGHAFVGSNDGADGTLSVNGGVVNVTGMLAIAWGANTVGHVNLCGVIDAQSFSMRNSGGTGTMHICCDGVLYVDDTDGSVKTIIDGYVANGWITCIDSQCSVVSVVWNGSDTTTVTCVAESGSHGFNGFTYQGHLIDTGDLANAEYDFEFRIFDGPTDGEQVGKTVRIDQQLVIDGNFAVVLDFDDPNIFNGDERWLEIAIRPGEWDDPNDYTELTPRDEITPTPYAIYAHYAGYSDFSGYSEFSGYSDFSGHSKTSDYATNAGTADYANTAGHAATAGLADSACALSCCETGAVVVSVDQNCNVGIGTTTPATKLDVNGIITAAGGNSDYWNLAYGWEDHADAGYLTSTSALDWDNITINMPADFADGIDNDTQLSEAQVDDYVLNNGYLDDTSALDWDNITINMPADFADGVDNVGIAAETDPQVGENTPDYVPKWNGSELATGTIYDNGNIGIGTDDPGEKLDVDGNIHASGTITSGSSITINGTNDTITATSGKISFDDEDIVTNGNVGIGTMSPTSLLSLGGNSDRAIQLERHTTVENAGSDLTVLAGGAAVGGTDLAGGDLYLSSGTATGTGASNIYFQVVADGQGSGTDDRPPATKVTILGSGNVGIGTTSPTQALQVAGTVEATNFVGPGPGLTGVIPADDSVTTSKISNGTIEFGDIGQNAASTGQVMKWNGAAWAPANDNLGAGGGSGWLDDGAVVRLETQGDMVGIGTTTPATKLDVNGTITAAGGNSDDWNLAYGWEDHADAGYLTDETDPTVLASVKDGVSWSEVTSIPAGFADDVDNDTQLSEVQVDAYVADNGYLTDETDPQVGANTIDYVPKWNGSELATGTIYDNGDVGIGTDDPAEKLDVDGNIHASGTITSGSSIIIDGNNDTITATSGKISFDDENIVTTGNVGIGTANPQVKLQIDGEGLDLESANAELLLVGAASAENGTVSPAIGFGVDDQDVMRSGISGVQTGTDSSLMGLAFYTPPSGSATDSLEEKVRIDHTGNVGIGTSEPQAKLEIDGEGIALDNGNAELLLTGAAPGMNGTVSPAIGFRVDDQGVMRSGISGVQTGTSSNMMGLSFYTHSGGDTAPLVETVTIDHTGNVGIGVLDPSEDLDVAGTARLRGMSSGGGTTVAVDGMGILVKKSSSRRYKKNIEDLETDPSAVLQLRPVSFQYRSSGNQDIGLIAEEVEEALRDLVIYDNQGRPDAVNYDGVALYMLEVVKMQEKKIATLEKRLEALERTKQHMEKDAAIESLQNENEVIKARLSAMESLATTFSVQQEGGAL